jgi:hypothetical protein
MVKWMCQRLLDENASINAVQQCGVFHYASRIACPVCGGFCFTPTGDLSVPTPVLALVGLGYECAILGVVAPIVISALDSQVVSVAVRECPVPKSRVGLPLRTHGDSTPAVITVAGAGGVLAALAHPGPNAEQAGSCITVTQVLSAHRLADKATARRGFPAQHCVRPNLAFNSAIATHEACPKTLASLADLLKTIGIKDDETSVPCAGQQQDAILRAHGEPPIHCAALQAVTSGAGASL